MSVGKSKDGTIYFSIYLDIDGEKKRIIRKSKSWKTLKEAKAAEDAFIARHKIDHESLSFSDLFERYKNRLTATRAPATIRNAELCYRKYLVSFHDKKITDINNHIIEDWQHWLLKQGMKNGTIERIQKVLRSIFNYGVKYDLIQKNPFTIPFVRDRAQHPDEMKIWTMDEFHQFLSVIDNFIERLMFRTLFFSACRVGELMALTINDFTGDSLIINKQKTKEGIIQSVKNRNGNRVVPLPASLCDDVSLLIQDYYAGTKSSSEWLFCGLAYGSRKQLEYWKNEYSKRAGLTPIRLHDFRHSMVSYLLSENRFTYKEVAKYIGDDVKTVIDTYGHVYGDLDSRIRAAVQDVDPGKLPKSYRNSEVTEKLPKKSPIFRS